MSLDLSSNAYLVTFLAIAISWLYRRYASSPQPQARISTKAPLRPQLSLVVLLHTIFIVYTIFVKYPRNIFASLRLPLTTPTIDIRTLLLHNVGLDSELAARASFPKPLETLLTRLGSSEVRKLYVRFGQAAIEYCEYCKTYDDYALYALPGPLLQYARTTAVMGLVTIYGSHKERWRLYSVGALVCAAVAEGYWVNTVHVSLPRNGGSVIMWHDVLWTIRHLLFLLLPLFVHLVLPASPPPPLPLSSFPLTLATLDRVLGRVFFLKYTYGSIMRSPLLREHTQKWWSQDKAEGDAIRDDADVQKVAELMGLGYAKPEGGEESKLRTSARMAVENWLKAAQGSGR